MKAKELREKPHGEKKRLLLDLSVKVRELRFSIASREERKHRQLRVVKKDLARLKTILAEDEFSLDQSTNKE